MLRDRFKRSYKVTKIAEQPNLPTTEQPSNRTTELPNYWNQNSSRDHKFAPNLLKSVEKSFSRLLKFKRKWWTLDRFQTKNEPWNQNCSRDLKSVSNLAKTIELSFLRLSKIKQKWWTVRRFHIFRYFHPPAKKKCLEIGSKEATKWPKSPNNQTFQPPNNRATEQLNCQTTELRITELRTPELPHRRTMYEPIHHTISQSSGCFCKTAGVRTLSDSVSSTSRWKVRLHCYSVLLVGV